MAAQVPAIQTGFRRSAASMLPKATASSSVRFQDLLDRARNDAASVSTLPQSRYAIGSLAKVDYTVKAGDTLSGICDVALRQQGKTPTGQDVTDAVEDVAKANHLANINRISVGQKLDLSSLEPAHTTTSVTNTVSATSASKATVSSAQSKDELTALIQSLIAKRVATANAKSTQAVLDGPVRISSGFGMRSDPFTGARELHSGVDLVASSGETVHPLEAGRVVFSGWQAGYGNTVIVQHPDGIQTVYAHNEKNMVRQGDTVTGTSKIAMVGSTGRSTGPHLHFEVRRAGNAIDPTPYLHQSRTQIAKAS